MPKINVFCSNECERVIPKMGTYNKKAGEGEGGRKGGKEWVGKGERGGIAFFVLATHEDLLYHKFMTQKL